MFILIQLQPFSDNIRFNRKLPAISVYEYRQGNTCWSAVIKKLIHCRSNGAPGMQYIVDQDDMPIFDPKRQAGWADPGVQADTTEVIAIKGNIEYAEGLVNPEFVPDFFSYPESSGLDTHQERVIYFSLLQLLLQLLHHA